MLVLKRKEGQWVEIIHRSGDVIRVRVYDIHADGDGPSRANLAFDDSARNFEVRRPERKPLTPVNAPGPEADAGFEPAAAAGLVGRVNDRPFDPLGFHLSRAVEPDFSRNLVQTFAGPVPKRLAFEGDGGRTVLAHDGSEWVGTEVVDDGQPDPGDFAVS